MTQYDYELIVLGSGPAGSTVATTVAESGRRVAMIESRQFGGTCALRGCNPKKVYANAAALIDCVRRADGMLVRDTDDVRLDWPTLLNFKRQFTQPVIDDKKTSLQDAGIDTHHGTARFIGPHTVEADGRKFSAEKIFIATGATPIALDIPGSQWITHSDEFFELETIPDRVLFIGGGYISMEFAHVVVRCSAHNEDAQNGGAKIGKKTKQVTVVEQGDHVLTGFDPDLISILKGYSEKRGIRFELNQAVESIEQEPTGALVVGLSGGAKIQCDLIVHGAGRVPNIADLDLDAGQIRYDKKGVNVDAAMRSVSNPNVFAAGDCASSGVPNLTPSAQEEARIVAKNLFESPVDDATRAEPDYGFIARVAFTTPAIASVGLSESEASRSHDIDVRTRETSTWGSVRKTGDTVAGYKIIIDRNSDRILGAHLLGPAAEETINLFALAMKFGITAEQLKSTLFAYPTFGADVRRMV